MLTFGSLFAGIGGIDLGLERAGMRCAWQVEIDDYATRVLEKHWPHVPKFRDVRECGTHNLARVDLIAGGFPCQPHSTSGKRKGAADDRNLWPEFARIIRELRPRWVLAENVPGLLSTDSGRFFGTVLGNLATLGYDAEWECIPAAALGAPHIRDRVYIVAYTDCAWNGGPQYQVCPGRHTTLSGGAYVAHAQGARSGQLATGRPDQDVADAERNRLEEPRNFTPARQPLKGNWPSEPDVGRMAPGVPARVDRLRGLGNAVVPQVAELIGRCILEHASAQEQRKAA